MNKAMPPHVDDIAGLVYDGVLQSSSWHNALHMMRSRLGAGVFHYFTLDSSGAQVPASVGNLESAGLHAERMGEYETQHAACTGAEVSRNQLKLTTAVDHRDHVTEEAWLN